GRGVRARGGRRRHRRRGPRRPGAAHPWPRPGRDLPPRGAAPAERRHALPGRARAHRPAAVGLPRDRRLGARAARARRGDGGPPRARPGYHGRVGAPAPRRVDPPRLVSRAPHPAASGPYRHAIQTSTVVTANAAAPASDPAASTSVLSRNPLARKILLPTPPLRRGRSWARAAKERARSGSSVRSPRSTSRSVSRSRSLSTAHLPCRRLPPVAIGALRSFIS